MSDEVFRFTVLRPAPLIQSKDEVVLGRHGGLVQRFDEIATSMEGSSSEEVEAALANEVNSHLESNSFPSDAGLADTVEAALNSIDQEEPADPSALEQIITNNFGQGSSSLIGDGSFIEFLGAAEDHLIATMATDRLPKDANPALASAVIQLANLIQRLAEGDSTLNNFEAIQQAMSEPVMLPESFQRITNVSLNQSVPTQNKEEETQKRLNALEEARKELLLLDESDFVIQDYSSTSIPSIEPIEPTIPTIDVEPTIAVIEDSDSIAEPITMDTVDTLPDISALSPQITIKEEVVTALSKNTKNVLQGEIKLDLQALDPYKAISKIEARIGHVLSESFETLKSYPTLADEDLKIWGKAQMKPIGRSDLQLVRQQIRRYDLGEIAHIENVMAGEEKKREHRRTRRVEEIFTFEEEVVEESEKDLQTADRFEMQSEAQKTVQEEAQLEAGLNVSAGYGPYIRVNASLAYSQKQSRESSSRESTKYAKEVTEKTRSKIAKRVREERIRKSSEEFEEKNLHQFTAKDKHIVGVYRWVDKVYDNQIYNYGERTMFEFIVPEPAAYLKWALESTENDNKPARPREPEYIGGKLKPEDLHLGNYIEIASRHGANVKPPPAEIQTLAFTQTSAPAPKKKDSDQKEQVTETAHTTFKIPDGYKASRVLVSASILGTDFAWGDIGATVTVGDMKKGLLPTCSVSPISDGIGRVIGLSLNPFNDRVWVTALDSKNISPELPLSIQVTHRSQASVSAIAFCRLTERGRREWQAETYSAIMNAYKEQRLAYEEEIAARGISEGVYVSGLPPAQNRRIEKNELKRLALTLFTRKHLELHPKTSDGALRLEKDKNPSIKLASVSEYGDYVQFFEDAFEWENMTYKLLPYFWSHRDRWNSILGIEDNDPLHADFLKSGAARILVPIRPNHEQNVATYLTSGKIWSTSGGKPPKVASKQYAGLLQKTNHNLEKPVKVGAPWSVKVPTTLVALEPEDGVKLPVWDKDGQLVEIT